MRWPVKYLAMVNEIPNFPFVITDEMIRKCGEPSEHPDMLVFGVEAYWAVYAWKHPDPEMNWWEVYIVEANELVVQFDVPIGHKDPFAYNVSAPPITCRMRIRHWSHNKYSGPECRHPLWGKLKVRRGCIPGEWYHKAGVLHDSFKGAVKRS